MQETKLIKGTTVYEQWANQNNPVYLKIYLFDVQNAQQVLNGEKPVLRERGPYTYREWSTKEILGWSEDQQHLQYRVHKTYEFDRIRSVGDETDQITVLNVPLAVSPLFCHNFLIGFIDQRLILILWLPCRSFWTLSMILKALGCAKQRFDC
jgi:hypothetical protein